LEITADNPPGESQDMEEMFTRSWSDLLARDSGPLHFRLVLQPVVAALLALRAGWRDAGRGHPVFFWNAVGDGTSRRLLLAETRRDVGKLFLVAVALDLIYQVIVLPWFYPIQTLIVAILLAIIPYVVIRGIVIRIVTHLRPQPKEDFRDPATV
jgi:hypothetical protein